MKHTHIKQQLTTQAIKIFECQIRDLIKTMHYSPFLYSMVSSYFRSNFVTYFHISTSNVSTSNNDLFSYVDLLWLRWSCENEKVDLTQKLDEISNILAFKIIEKIGYADMCYVLKQDDFIRAYIEKERLVIKVINGAYKSSEIRAIHPQLLFTSQQEQ